MHKWQNQLNLLMKTAVITIVLTLLLPLPALSYECDKGRRATLKAEDRFDVDADGTLTDIKSGLTWMRCALGQSWNGTTCTGFARAYSWETANQEIQKINQNGGFGSYTDWRLPRLPELASIADNYCSNPRIDLTLFPNTPSVTFWSGDKRSSNVNSVYILDFGPAGVSASAIEEQNHVRLVRGRE